MMTNNPNANLIEAMKEKLPLKGQLADMLMDTLYIGKEAVYRRLRGEVPFTLQESALISRKLGISLDKIIGLSFKSNAMFNINIVDYDDPFESYYNILEKYVSLINTMPDDPNSVMGTSANIIPQTLYLKHELLAKFRLFKWMYQNKYIDCKSFEELDIPPKLVNIQKDYVAMTRHIHSIDYIWDNTISNTSPASISFPTKRKKKSKKNYSYWRMNWKNWLSTVKQPMAIVYASMCRISTLRQHIVM